MGAFWKEPMCDLGTLVSCISILLDSRRSITKWKIQYGSTPQLSLEAVKFHRPWRALSVNGSLWCHIWIQQIVPKETDTTAGCKSTQTLSPARRPSICITQACCCVVPHSVATHWWWYANLGSIHSYSLMMRCNLGLLSKTISLNQEN